MAREECNKCKRVTLICRTNRKRVPLFALRWSSVIELEDPMDSNLVETVVGVVTIVEGRRISLICPRQTIRNENMNKTISAAILRYEKIRDRLATTRTVEWLSGRGIGALQLTIGLPEEVFEKRSERLNQRPMKLFQSPRESRFQELIHGISTSTQSITIIQPPIDSQPHYPPDDT